MRWLVENKRLWPYNNQEFSRAVSLRGPLCEFQTSSIESVSLPPPPATVLCSERVGQVTKTYHDIKAVTHLLEEVRGRHRADERDYERLCRRLSRFFGLSVSLQCIQKEMSVFVVLPANSESFSFFLSVTAERAGSGVSGEDRPVAAEAEPRADGSQWNDRWAAGDCKGRGTKRAHAPLRFVLIPLRWS